MPLPVITDVFQAKLRWTNPNMQRPATNDLHFFDNAGGSTPANLMTALNAHVTANMWELVSSASAITNVLVTRLDGSTATQTFTPATPAHWTGGGDIDATPQGCSVVTIQSALRGRSNRNRVYLPWVAEDSVTEGTILPANLAIMQAAWDAFFTAMAAANFPVSVISPKLSSSLNATAFVCRPFLKTQRRRARR